MKLSKNKHTLPGRKQVYRYFDKDGCLSHDVIALAHERCDGVPLLQQVIKNGSLTYTLPSLKDIRQTAADSLSKLPQKYKKVTNAPPYPVDLSSSLANLVAELKEKIIRNEITHASI
jgi:nicotinate phosphoribosyltransferase